MALTAAERAKRYRDKKKADPETHAKYLQKERERYKARKQNGEFKISSKSERAQNYIRRKWRTKQRERRQRTKLQENAVKFMEQNTPVSSPTRLENGPNNQNEQNGPHNHNAKSSKCSTSKCNLANYPSSYVRKKT